MPQSKGSSSKKEEFLVENETETSTWGVQITPGSVNLEKYCTVLVKYAILESPPRH